MSKSRFRRVAQKLTLVVVGIVISLFLGECIIRATGLAPEVVSVEKGRFRLSPNKKIGYEPVPGKDYSGKSLDFYDYRGKANSLGYRDYEHPLEKPPGRYRILVLGDSITAGLFVPKNEQMFSSVLERTLNMRGLKVEVMNFGVSGYDTQQEVETFKERGRQYHPDLVILAYCLNDRERNDGGILATLLAQAHGSKSAFGNSSLLHKSALFRFIWYRVLKEHKKHLGEYAQIGQDTVNQYVTELAQLAKKDGFDVLVTVFPELSNLNDYEAQAQNNFIEAIAKRNHLAVLDLLDAFRRCGGNLAHDHYHPNLRGHLCAGHAIADRVEPLVRGRK